MHIFPNSVNFAKGCGHNGAVLEFHQRDVLGNTTPIPIDFKTAASTGIAEWVNYVADRLRAWILVRNAPRFAGSAVHHLLDARTALPSCAPFLPPLEPSYLER